MSASRKVVVTGADGFIGSHVCEALVQSGADVCALVWYNAFGRSGWLDTLGDNVRTSLEIVAGDIRDPHQMLDLLEGADVVYHLAALIGVPYSYHAPDSYVQTNVTGTLNLLQAARTHKVSRFVHTSTSEVYGTAQTLPMNETHPLVGQSPYAASKIAADQMVMAFHRSFDLPVVIVRPFNTYGPRQSLRAVIPSIVLPAIDGTTEISLGNLDAERDFTYVSDTVTGLTLAARSESAVGETLNLGTGQRVSINQIVDLVATIAGRELKVSPQSERLRPESSEVDRLECDASRAREYLGWQPEISLEDGLRQVWQWFSNNDNRRQYVHHGYTV